MRFDPSRPGAVVRVAVLLGVVAGLVGAVFMTVVGEPWVDDAIALEEANVVALEEANATADEADSTEAGDHAHEPEIVSRSDQRGAGLFAAYGVAGGAFGLLFALVFLGLRASGHSPFRRSMLAGGALAGAITVAPWLKYPPNPPAVGDPETLSERQWEYLAVIVVTGAVFFVVARLSGHLRRAGWAEHRRVGALVGVVVLVMGLALTLLPAPSDPVEVPANLVWHFRLASLGGNLLLWTVLSVGFGFLASERAGVGEAAQPPAALTAS